MALSQTPRGAWALWSIASVALLMTVCAATSNPIETVGIDLRHRWVALTAGRAPTEGPSAEAPAMGMNVFLEQEVEPEKRQRSLDLLRAAGVSWIRQELPWEQIEPLAKGQTSDPTFGGSTWSKFDDIVDRVSASGMRLMLRLDTSPRWALPPGAIDGMSPPNNTADYFDFVSEVAERYRGKVAAYQIWNEPNLESEWGHKPPNAAAYATLLQGASERIRAADPSALVVMAALSPTLTESSDALNELVYLQQLYDGGVKGAYDVLAVQAYGLRGGPDDPRTGGQDVTFSRPTLVRQVMERNGDGATPVWATEMGWNVNPFGDQTYGVVTPTLQARYTVRAFDRVRQQWPWLQVGFIWFWKRPDTANRDQAWYWFRLADPDFALQPAYYAVRDAAETGWR
jgi:polysaccharide biosynthesis protein PslG